MDKNNIKDKIEDLKGWVEDHAKIVMPAVLLVCVMVTAAVAMNANQKTAKEAELQAAEVTANLEVMQAVEETAAEEEVPVPELEEDAHPEVNALIGNYYAALAEGNPEEVAGMNHMMEENARLRIQEMSKYIESYPELKVYTKTGPVENSFLAYVYSKVKFTEYDKLVPGMQAFYICADDNGNYYINEGEDDTVITDYIREVSLQDDVVDLNNQVAAEYNELLDSDEELTAFLADLGDRIDASVGKALAAAEQERKEAEAAAAAELASAQEEATPEEQPVVQTVRAKEVVNIRSSDSETADKLGKAQTGDEFTLLEAKGNGWSRISFEGRDAFIKSEFLEAVITETASAETPEEEASDETASEQTASSQESDVQETEEVQQADASAESSQGTVTVIENVNVRKSASENGERLGLVYIGEKLELLMKQADGWTKIRYKGQTAYVKSDYVE